MKTVLAFGTFDLFHAGHDYFLTEAKRHGDRLVVVVARDVNVERMKGARPEHTESERVSRVSEHPAVDTACLGYENWNMRLQVLVDIQPNVICLGYDQNPTLPPGTWEIVRIDAYKPDKFKTSILKQGRVGKDRL